MKERTDWAHFRLLAVDMDGTLAGADHRVTARTVGVLARAERVGLHTVVVTGRAYPTALDVWRQAGLTAPLVTCGGALILQPPELRVVKATFLPDDVVQETLRLGRELDLTVSLWTQDAIWVTRQGMPADVLATVNAMVTSTIESGPRAPVPYGPRRVLKVMVGADPRRLDEVADDVLSRLASVKAARSMPQFIEATPLEASKRQALIVVLDGLHINPADAIAIGDGDNDVDMLLLAGLAVVPSNAMPGPRAVAHRIIGHHDREAVAEFVEEILQSRGN